MWTLTRPPLFAALAAARRVLVSGAGGGFDVYAGLPLAVALRAEGKAVHLGNLTFADLHEVPTADRLAPDVTVVGPHTAGSGDYFPERTLARYLSGSPLEPVVYTFERVGVQPLRAAYQAVVDYLGVDAIVLIDGGTDILMRGDEAGIGTPEEDMASLAAVAGVDGVATRLVVCAGLGIDSYHGVSNTDTLENIAALAKAGAYLGTLSIPADSAEAVAYLDAVDYARVATPRRPSIVNGQVAAAVRGEFGDVQFTHRTAGGVLHVNPLMALYFSFDLMGVYRHLHYRERIEHTRTAIDMSMAIEAYRREADLRPRRSIPH
ncbi:MAG TPA: DUF1152 domain-containing protein [Micromonosporaceae bacterium]|nr:DUF1152 domain-containing protein [Micromonosporaceae bacterium]